MLCTVAESTRWSSTQAHDLTCSAQESRASALDQIDFMGTDEVAAFQLERISLRHRIGALILRRQWRYTPGERIMTFFTIPLLVYVCGALPNALTGGSPEAQELLVQV